MLTLSQFRTRWPEFAGVVDATVQAALDDAAQSVSAAVYGGLLDRAHGLRAAHLLVSSPWGGAARLNPKDKTGETVYSKALLMLINERAGIRGMT